MEDAYVINLKHRTDRWEKMRNRWSSFFNLIRYDGIILPKDDRPHDRRASEGLTLTHRRLLKELHDKGETRVLILEDDAVPEPNWFERWVEIKAHLDTHENWEVFNGGSHFLRHYKRITELSKSVLIDGKLACAGHFLYLNLTHYDRLIQPTTDDIDMFYSTLHFWCSYPLLAKQEDDTSDIINSERKWDYTYKANELDFARNLGRVYLKYKLTS